MGFTLECRTDICYFWLGGLKGVGHKATLAGSALISRVRAILDISTPSAAAARAKATFESADGEELRAHVDKIEGLRAGHVKPAAIHPPEGGWDSATVANAAEDLGVTIGQLIECRPCGAIREHGNDQACPYCGSTVSGAPRGYYGTESITKDEPKKKGRAKKDASATK
jgi:hypothetical protein